MNIYRACTGAPPFSRRANHQCWGGAHATRAQRSLRKSAGSARPCALSAQREFGNRGTDPETRGPDCPHEPQDARNLVPFPRVCTLEPEQGCIAARASPALFKLAKTLPSARPESGRPAGGRPGQEGSLAASERGEAGPGRPARAPGWATGRFGTQQGRAGGGVPSGLTVGLGSPSFLT